MVAEVQKFSEIVVAINFSGGRVDQQHVAWAQAPALGDFHALEICQTHLGAGDQQAVRGERVAHGPQTIAIELYANHAAIAKNHGCGTVPRLLLAGLNFQIAAQARAERLVRFPCRRDHAQNRCGQAVAALQQIFQRVVETGGIADAFFERHATNRRLRVRGGDRPGERAASGGWRRWY